MIALFFAPGHEILSIFLLAENGPENLDLTHIGYTLSIRY